LNIDHELHIKEQDYDVVVEGILVGTVREMPGEPFGFHSVPHDTALAFRWALQKLVCFACEIFL
jgi:hypothetical protein